MSLQFQRFFSTDDGAANAKKNIDGDKLKDELNEHQLIWKVEGVEGSRDYMLVKRRDNPL